METTKLTAEESFRNALEDVKAIVTQLGNVFKTTEELIGAVDLALVNDGQLKLIMSLMARKK